MSDSPKQHHNAFEAGKPGTSARSRIEDRIERLRKEGGIFVEAVRATRMPMVVTDPSLPGNPIVFANDAFLRLSGYGMAEVLGQQPHFMNGAETDEADAGRFREALDQDRDALVETVQHRKDGSRFVASVLLSAFKDAAGGTAHQFLSYLDVTRQVTAETEVKWRKDTEARLRTLFAASSEVQYRMSADWGEMRELKGGGFLSDTVHRNRSWLMNYIPADEQSRVTAAIDEAINTKSLFELEHRVRRADGSIGWTLSRAAPLLNPDGTIAEWFGTANDVTARREAEDQLRESEERYRAIIESVRDYAIFTTDTQDRIQTWPPGAEAVFGWSAEEAVGQLAAITFTPEDREGGVPEQEVTEARENGYAPNMRWHIRKDGQRVFIEGSTRPLRNGSREPHGFIKVGQDVTERRAFDERQKVLVAELQHRTRNLMAVVRSMANSSLERSIDLADFQARFGARLGALARVQGLLSRLEEWDRVTFDTLIRSELAALDGDAERVILKGPKSVALRSSTVQTFALALHELTTNALKYGALAQPQGQLAISWYVKRAEEDAKPWLHVDWRETGVAMQAEGMVPRGGGSGRELIERALPYQLGAKTTYVMEEDGVHCTIALPVSERHRRREKADA